MYNGWIVSKYLQKYLRKLSLDNYFGSKFITVVVTGDSNNQIYFEGYQVSNQCMALVRDNCIIPTYDAPELAHIKESSNEKFVPIVYYRLSVSISNAFDLYLILFKRKKIVITMK